MSDARTRWLRAFDAIRPDSDDRQDPELAADIASAEELLDRESPEFPREAIEKQLAEFDRRVADVLPGIEVPTSLEMRILTALDTGCDDAGRESAAAAVVTPSRDDIHAATERPRRRWQWIAVATVAATVAFVFLAGIFVSMDRDAISEDMLYEMAVRWSQELPQEGWRQEGALGAALEPSLRMAAAPRAFQRVDFRGDGLGRGIAYRYLSMDRDGVEATLFVAPLPSSGCDQLATNPPEHPPATSHGLVAAWRDSSRGLLFIVVIREAPHHVLTERYRSLVNTYAPTA